MKSVNRMTLLGRAGIDAESRSLNNGNTVARITLATTRSYKTQGSDDWKDDTQWHKVVFWGKLAERVVGQYGIKKGDQVYIEGEMRYSEYTDKEGVKRTQAEIHASDMMVVNRKEPITSGGGGYQQQQQQGGGYSNVPATGANEYEDDLPF